MKIFKKKINLTAIAFFFAIAAAFAFRAPAEFSESWFSVAPDGTIGQEIPGNPGCIKTMEYCAVKFDDADLVNGQPPVSNVEDDDADLYIVELTFRDIQ